MCSLNPKKYAETPDLVWGETKSVLQVACGLKALCITLQRPLEKTPRVFAWGLCLGISAYFYVLLQAILDRRNVYQFYTAFYSLQRL